MSAPAKLSSATRRIVAHLRYRLMYACNDAERQAYLLALAGLGLS